MPPRLWQSRNRQKHDTSLCRQSSRSRPGRDGRLPVLSRPARAASVPEFRPYSNTNPARTPETSAHKQVFIYEHDSQNRSFSPRIPATRELLHRHRLQIEVEFTLTTHRAAVFTPESGLRHERCRALNTEPECAKVIMINRNQRRLQKP
jgi:hypothetical protein